MKCFLKSTNDWELINPTTNHLRRFKPTIKTWSISSLLPRKDAVVIHRLAIGHTRLNKKVLFTNDQSDTICPKCDQFLSIQHLLIDCQGLNDIREATIGNRNLHEIIKDDLDQSKRIIQYLKEAQLYSSI